MSNDCNKCVFTGRLGKDPEMGHRPNGEAFTTFILAVNKRWREGATGVQKESTTWLRCIAKGGLAESIQRTATKGRFVLIEAEYRTRKEMQAGAEVSRHEHLVSSIQYLDRKIEPVTSSRDD